MRIDNVAGGMVWARDDRGFSAPLPRQGCDAVNGPFENGETNTSGTRELLIAAAGFVSARKRTSTVSCAFLAPAAPICLLRPHGSVALAPQPHVPSLLADVP